MRTEKITAWVTRYALTSGVRKVDGEVCHEISSKMVAYGKSEYAHNDDWHRTPEAALAKAEDMRTKKIASLRKQIQKLEKIKFEETP
jgi:hypothetical protein